MYKFFLIVVMFFISHYVSASSYLGNEPDCWSEPRAFHINEETGEYISKHIFITRNAEIPSNQFDYISPNNGYSFSLVNDRPNSTITINAEKKYLTVIELRNIFGVTQTKWVNENLLFFRVYFGQEIFVDVLFNVESEGIALSMLGRYSKSAIQQYEQGCKLHGQCVCAKK